MSAVDDVYDWLGAEGLVGSDYVAVKRNVTDDVPNKAVFVIEDGGPDAEVGSEEGSGDTAMAFPGVLLRFRGEPGKAVDVQGKAQEVKDRLHGLYGVDLGATHYLQVLTLGSEPLFIGYDDRKRPEFTVAIRLTREQAAPAS